MDFGSIALGVYLVIVGASTFVPNTIPAWFTGGCALVAGAVILLSGLHRRA